MPRTTVVAKDSHLVSLPPTELENLQPAILALVDVQHLQLCALWCAPTNVTKEFPRAQSAEHREREGLEHSLDAEVGFSKARIDSI